LVIARISVSGVKKPMKMRTPQAPNLGLYPKSRDIPMVNSVAERSIARGRAMGFRKSIPKATK